jgi:3-deoxy-D-manno-octulosonic acid kinase
MLMMTNGGRVATAQGAMLADPDLIGNSLRQAGEALFDPQFWAARGELDPASAGRGAAWFVGTAGNAWVLKHYRRGGLVARFSRDRYWFRTEASVRAFAEWRLLERLHGQGLPVPRPVAARYVRNAFSYRCDLLTERIPAVRPLSALLAEGVLGDERWRSIGATIRRVHQAGADHADLNAHNILCGELEARVFIIDFDRGRLRAGAGDWQRRNLERLHRSIVKVAPATHFSAAAWDQLLAGYG